MADETLSLAAETAKAPASTASFYVQIGEAAELIGGGTVYLSRNRKSAAKWEAPAPKPPVFVTSEVGNTQQSVMYRAVGTALAHDVIPMGQVLDLYAKNERMADLIAMLAADYPDELTGELTALGFIADDVEAPTDAPTDDDTDGLALQ